MAKEERCPHYECHALKTQRLFGEREADFISIRETLCSTDYEACPTYKHLEKDVRLKKILKETYAGLFRSFGDQVNLRRSDEKNQLEE